MSVVTGMTATGRAHAPAPPTRPQLIATDLDGTFLSPDGTVSAQNRAAVLAAQEAGIPVLFATGRPVRWLEVIADLPGAHPTVVASNGAVLYDLGERRVLDRICVDPEVALQAVARIRAGIPGCGFAFETGTHFGYEPPYETVVADDGTDPTIFSGTAEEIVRAGTFVKMLVQSRELSPDGLLERVQPLLGDSLTATHSAARSVGLVEISAPGVNKAAMLRRCCERLGVAADRVAAFGDMPNDLDMLGWAGMPRVVANAHPAVVALGYPVVPGNTDSGVGRTILAWLGLDRAGLDRPEAPPSG